MTASSKPKQYVCPKCNVCSNGDGPEGSMKAKPKCGSDHVMTEVMPFWQTFVGGMLGVPLSYMVLKFATWMSPVVGQLIWAFVGLWPLAAVIALCQGIGYAFRAGPARMLAPQSFGMGLGMVFSFVPVAVYFLLTMAR